jgi:hypothetical protein
VRRLSYEGGVYRKLSNISLSLFLCIRPAALPGCALGVVVRFAGETGLDTAVMVLDLLIRQFVGTERNAVVNPIILGFS